MKYLSAHQYCAGSYFNGRVRRTPSFSKKDVAAPELANAGVFECHLLRLLDGYRTGAQIKRLTLTAAHGSCSASMLNS